MRLLRLLTCLSLALTVATAAAAQAVWDGDIRAKAAAFNLGRPLPEAPRPVQTSSPHDSGWWQAFLVEGAGIEASPTSYRGPCPGLIKFRGKIQASAAGRVKYTYSYSDGAGGPEGFVDFEGPGVKYVETDWRLGDARTLPRYEGWTALKILSPNEYESNRAKFMLECNPAGRVRASATFEPLLFQVIANAFVGYASAEAIVNLRVMEGAREVCSERVSLGRTVATVVGGSSPHGHRPMSLQCEFNRPNPGDATTYNLIAELETWTGGGGVYAYAWASISTTLRQFQVYLHRR